MVLEEDAQVNQQVALPTDEDRKMIRESVRGFLGQHWPVEHAVERATQPEAVSEIWRGLCEQGLATLGTDPSEGGLREVLVVVEELGRASCPAPMLGAAAANMALWPRRESAPVVSALLEHLHEGRAAVSLAFGAFDGDGNGGRAELKDGCLTGQINFVEGMSCATHVLVFLEQGPAVAVLETGAPGMTITPTPGFAVPPVSDVAFSNTPAVVLELSVVLVEDLNLLFRLGLAVRAVGAARRSFELAVEYAKIRYQFGQPIGRFQAIQHKLADCLISLDGAKLTIDNAASTYDHGVDDWRVFASAAYAFASPAIRQVSLETHHTFGAIGYAEEHEAPRHFRRVHADLVRCGGVMNAREELADYLLGSAE
jgi:alkylation response protein AidB-like acyl-CoA dehydrogenase